MRQKAVELKKKRAEDKKRREENGEEPTDEDLGIFYHPGGVYPEDEVPFDLFPDLKERCSKYKTSQPRLPSWAEEFFGNGEQLNPTWNEQKQC